MKRFVFVCILLIVLGLLFGGCGHQMGVIGIGTGFRAGGGEYGISYGEGLFGTFVTRDGIEFKAEIDSTTGFSYDPTTNSYKGIRSIEYAVQPQVNGYTCEFARDNPEVAKLYYEALLKYYESRKSAPAQISDGKSTSATANVADVLKKALERFKGKGGDAPEPFDCDGDCELTNLDAIGLREWQTAAAKKLLTYADETTKIHDSDLTCKATLKQFLARMQQYADKGIGTVGLRVRRATVKGGVLQDLTYVYIADGREVETNCPECIFIPGLDVKGDEAE